MGFLDFLLGTAFVMNVLDTRDPKRPRNVTPVDDDYEAHFDDGYSDDYVGDGLDGTDDYVGDGLDGSDDYDDPE